MNKRRIILTVTFLVCCLAIHAQLREDTLSKPGKQQRAITFLDSIGRLAPSKYWPNVDADLFLVNLRTFVLTPLRFYEGKGTNFCAYSAITYIPLNYDPEGFSRFMITLYKDGKARMGKVWFRPGKKIRNEAGQIRYKGALDISPAGQMWFLCLADRFKGYLNIFNRHFDKGDENTLWASTNFAKFNRMLRRLFLFEVHARGSDLIRPHINDIYKYLSEMITEGPIFLYLNNRLLYKKKHVVTRFGIPTHYVLLLDIYKSPGNKINIVYWDYGKKTLQQVPAALLKKIIYGITHFNPAPKNE
ncbi:MAG: hypothetical protein ABWZ25_05235 [Chitinophagaceae bacterium]